VDGLIAILKVTEGDAASFKAEAVELDSRLSRKTRCLVEEGTFILAGRFNTNEVVPFLGRVHGHCPQMFY
jgi:hypothetical protein